MASGGLSFIKESADDTRSEVCNEPAVASPVHAPMHGLAWQAGDRPCQWSECPVWLCGMAPPPPPCLVDAGPDGLSLQAEECGTLDLLTLACTRSTIPVSCRRSANGYVQQSQPRERGISKG